MTELHDTGNVFARQLGVTHFNQFAERFRELSGRPDAWFEGWYGDNVAMLAEGGTLMGVYGSGMSRLDRTLSVYVLLVWSVMPEPRPAELDAWATTVLISWGWRLQGSLSR